jgi:FdhD protein
MIAVRIDSSYHKINLSNQHMTTEASITQATVIVTPEGQKDALEHVAIETPYIITLNEIEIGASMVLPTGLEEFGVGFLFGQGYIQHPGEVKEVIVCPEGRISVRRDRKDSPGDAGGTY